MHNCIWGEYIDDNIDNKYFCSQTEVLGKNAAFFNILKQNVVQYNHLQYVHTPGIPYCLLLIRWPVNTAFKEWHPVSYFASPGSC